MREENFRLQVMIATGGATKGFNDFMIKSQLLHYELVKKMLERERDAKEMLLKNQENPASIDNSTQTCQYVSVLEDTIISETSQINEQLTERQELINDTMINPHLLISSYEATDNEFIPFPNSFAFYESESNFTISLRNSDICLDSPNFSTDENLSTCITSPALKSTTPKSQVKIPPLPIEKLRMFVPIEHKHHEIPMSKESENSSLNYSKNSGMISIKRSECNSNSFNFSVSPRTPRADVDCTLTAELKKIYGVSQHPGDESISVPSSMTNRWLHSRESSVLSISDENNIPVYIPKIIPIAFSILGNSNLK